MRYNINACGDVYTATNGDITSPAYPNADRTESECFYLIQIEPGKKIRLKILELQLATPNCDASYLKIFNGGLPVEEALLATKCSSSSGSNAQFESTGAEMIFSYKTDVQSNKFRVEYSSLEGGCGAHFINEEGISPEKTKVEPIF